MEAKNSVGPLYHYFPNKESIISALITRMVDEASLAMSTAQIPREAALNFY